MDEGKQDEPRHVSLSEKLQTKLPESFVQTRQQGGATLRYVSTYSVISLANRLFGNEGWTYRVLEPVACSFASETTCVYSCRVEVSIRTEAGDWITRSDVGTCGATRNAGLTGDQHEMAIKGCVSDGIKRALHGFGPIFGLDLYA